MSTTARIGCQTRSRIKKCDVAIEVRGEAFRE